MLGARVLMCLSSLLLAGGKGTERRNVTGCLLKDTAAVGGELKKIGSLQVKVPGVNDSVVLSPKWHFQYMLQYDIPRLEKLLEVERI